MSLSESTAAGPRFARLSTPAGLAGIALARVPVALIGDAQRRAIRALPAEPGPFFSFGCFECRLGEDPRVDFLACMLDSDGAREAVSAQPHAVTGPHAPLVDAWSSESPASLDTGGLWLEWDAGASLDWRPFAFVRAAERVPPGRWSEPRLAAWLDWAGPRLTPGGPSAELRQAVLRANASLPASGKIHHLALTSARGGSEAIRLHVGLAKRELATCLRGLGFAGNLAVVGEILDAWSALPDPVGVQLEVAGRAPSWIDLEFYLNTTPADDARWGCFARWAESLAGVSRVKLEAALAWGEPCALPDPTALLLRRTSFKARVRTEGAIEVKAYLGFSPRSIPGSGTNTRDQATGSTMPQAPSLEAAAARASGSAAPSTSHASANASSRHAR